MEKDELNTTSDRGTMSGDLVGYLGHVQSAGPPSVFNPMEPRRLIIYMNNEPLVTFNPDGTVDVHGETYEGAKAFWHFVKQFAAEEYAKHAAARE